ncbi:MULTISPECIES: hypothetical protein [unclassified Saccharopolyspora]|uniref:hypothetical protein n=1 Tax=unclassified Saccharopolyspora TaxID=2646250 RepID=UPI001CD52F91|nr:MULTISPECIES: hypothetical protein [unclassified Saccharopolyspora]MCA1186475.1 hypothetical protein [Saccharopolyspora sp. 6T]MCA1282761.1 hypothetical protein [Saccharopolyspora sp. 7B]
MTRGESVYGTVRRIDSSMGAMNRVLRKFGTPKEVASELRAVKTAVGEVIAQLEMAERRS